MNRLVDNCLVIIVILAHFGDSISSDGELYVVVLRIGFVDHLTIGVSTSKYNLLTIAECNGR